MTQDSDTSSALRDCPGAGEDGESQAGVEFPMPGLTESDDGTVNDKLSGLIWLKDADCPAARKTGQEALDCVALLNTTAVACTDYAAMTCSDWRLPQIKELLSLMDSGEVNPALSRGHPFTGVQGDWYWSSSPAAGRARAWVACLFGGDGLTFLETDNLYVWSVRGGQ